MEVEIKEGYNIVIYTDGAAKGDLIASRGFYGCGYFGYVYERQSIGTGTKSLPASVSPTTLGFTSPELEQQDLEFYKKAQQVQPIKYLIGSISGTEINTNNYAEALALNKAIKAILKLELDIKNVLFKLDSNMLIYVLNEMISNADFDKNKYAYPDLYEDTHKDIKNLKDKGVELRVKHVYGHSGSFGNNIADRLAFLGRTKSEESNNQATSVELVIDADPKKDNFWFDLNLPEFIYGKTLYFLPKDETQERNPYLILDYSKDQELGMKDGEVLMASIYSGLEDDTLETIKNKHLTIKPDFGNIFALDIDNLKHYLTNFFMRVDPSNIFTKNNRPGNLTVLEEYPIIRTIKPGSLAMQLIENFFVHEEILRLLPTRDAKTFEFIDITDKFFKETVDKKGNVIRECIISNKEPDIVVPIEGGNIFLVSRVDIPNRNYFKRLEKIKDLQVVLVTRMLSETCKEYFTAMIGTLPDGKKYESVWCNNYSNKFYKNKNK